MRVHTEERTPQARRAPQVEYYVACQKCGHPLAIRSVLGKIYVWKYNYIGLAAWDAMQTKCPKCKTSILTKIPKEKT